MKKYLVVLCLLIITAFGYAQTGHIMQGVGATNMSMGGAATAQPLDINGALLWNPATISSFNGRIISVNAGAFFSSRPFFFIACGYDGPRGTGSNEHPQDDRGTSVMPALAMIFAKPASKHTFGVSAFGISGFGVTFPQEANNPLSDSFDPSKPSNPINYPQQAGGFGLLQSDYMLLQVGFTYSYKLSDKLMRIQPTFNYSSLELIPNPLSSPSMTLGYTNK
ncbi:MAG: hypothetical protein U5K54_25500 [Cytophagales bacterium]|nr:hypothetical protein [Cytophagales bacterium]